MTTLYVHPADEPNPESYSYTDTDESVRRNSGRDSPSFRGKKRSFRNKHSSPRHRKFYGNKSMNHHQFHNHGHASQRQSSRGQRQYQQSSSRGQRHYQSPSASATQFSTPRSLYQTGSSEYADVPSSNYVCTPTSFMAHTPTPVSVAYTPPNPTPLSMMSTPTSCSSTVAPPSLYFPIHDEHAGRIINNQSTDSFGFANMAALGSPPPLSELTSSDGRLLLNVDDYSELEKLSIPEIQARLNAQRMQNEQLLVKLHGDQNKFQKIVQHYEKKNALLQHEISILENENPSGNECAQRMNILFNEHQTEFDLNQQEHFQYQESKNWLWKGISTNMQLLADVNSLTQTIDNYHLLISRKRKQMAIRNGEYIKLKRNIKNIQDDQKDEEEATTTNNDDPTICKQAKPDSAREQAESKMMEEAPTSVYVDVKKETDAACQVLDAANTEQDPLEQYANQLLDTNKRYQEIVGLLRKKMDELRAYWKKL